MDEPYVRIDWRQSIDAVVKKLIYFAFSVLTSGGGVRILNEFLSSLT